MNRKLIFLGSGSPFMMKTVIRNLRTAGYDVVSVEADIARIDREQEGAEAVILFLGDELTQRRDVLLYIKQLCDGRRRNLFIIGDSVDTETCIKAIGNDVVTATFRVPLNIPEFITRVKQLTEHSSVRSMKHILLVDDDGDYLKMVSRWLSVQYRVTIVNSGMQAITFLANNRPDLILLDYAMPVTSGPQVLEMIRSETSTKDIPVFFLTGKDDSESVSRVLELGPNGYILKNITRSELHERLDEFFSGASAAV